MPEETLEVIEGEEESEEEQLQIEGRREAKEDSDEDSDSGSADSLDDVLRDLKKRVGVRETQLNTLRKNVWNQDPERRTIYVGQVDVSTLPEDLYLEIFSECGTIKNIMIHTNQDGIPLGFAFIEFAVCQIFLQKNPARCGHSPRYTVKRGLLYCNILFTHSVIMM